MAEASSKEKFEAAVNVIKGLPKNGTFQPSNELLLKFYAYFKQATVGPCNIPKPWPFDVVNKAKWDAWKKIEKMTAEEARINYINELKNIVETMPQTDNVSEFMDKLGHFYEVVDDTYKARHQGNLEEINANDLDTDPALTSSDLQTNTNNPGAETNLGTMLHSNDSQSTLSNDTNYPTNNDHTNSHANIVDRIVDDHAYFERRELENNHEAYQRGNGFIPGQYTESFRSDDNNDDYVYENDGYDHDDHVYNNNERIERYDHVYRNGDYDHDPVCETESESYEHNREMISQNDIPYVDGLVNSIPRETFEQDTYVVQLLDNQHDFQDDLPAIDEIQEEVIADELTDVLSMNFVEMNVENDDDGELTEEVSTSDEEFCDTSDDLGQIAYHGNIEVESTLTNSFSTMAVIHTPNKLKTSKDLRKNDPNSRIKTSETNNLLQNSINDINPHISTDSTRNPHLNSIQNQNTTPTRLLNSYIYENPTITCTTQYSDNTPRPQSPLVLQSYTNYSSTDVENSTNHPLCADSAFRRNLNNPVTNEQQVTTGKNASSGVLAVSAGVVVTGAYAVRKQRGGGEEDDPDRRDRRDERPKPDDKGRSSNIAGGGGPSRRRGPFQQGGSGGQDGEHFNPPPGDVNLQISAALIRLQQDMSAVISRLDSLECLTRNRGVIPQWLRRLLPNVSRSTFFFMIVWPFLVHCLMVYMFRRRRRFLLGTFGSFVMIVWPFVVHCLMAYMFRRSEDGSEHA